VPEECQGLFGVEKLELVQVLEQHRPTLEEQEGRGDYF